MLAILLLLLTASSGFVPTADEQSRTFSQTCPPPPLLPPVYIVQILINMSAGMKDDCEDMLFIYAGTICCFSPVLEVLRVLPES
jgi:hypothetical protein